MAAVSPPPELVRALVDGPSLVTSVAWFDEVDSTNRAAADAAKDGTAEGYLAIADVQTAGRGRHGRTWVAPPGTSLLLSVLLRPAAPVAARPLLPLLAGVAVAETVARHVPGSVTLKWPNDVLIGGRKAAGILAEGAGDAVVVGIGLDVDWRGVMRPADLDAATSLAEVAGRDIDRWRLLAGILGIFSRRYAEWLVDPTGFLPAYRLMCSTLGQPVRVHLGREQVTGTARTVDDAGHLGVDVDGGGKVRTFAAGDVEHLR